MGREKKNRETISKQIEEVKDRKIIVSGDFNARTGEDGRGWDEDGEKKTQKIG